MELELDRLVERSTLLTAGAIYIRVVGIDVAAFDTPKHSVVAGSGTESTLSLFSVDCQPSQPGQQQHHIPK